MNRLRTAGTCTRSSGRIDPWQTAASLEAWEKPTFRSHIGPELQNRCLGRRSSNVSTDGALRRVLTLPPVHIIACTPMRPLYTYSGLCFRHNGHHCCRSRLCYPQKGVYAWQCHGVLPSSEDSTTMQAIRATWQGRPVTQSAGNLDCRARPWAWAKKIRSCEFQSEYAAAWDQHRRL